MNLRQRSSILIIVLAVLLSLFASSVAAWEHADLAPSNAEAQSFRAQRDASAPESSAPQETKSPLPKLPPAVLAKIDPRLLKQLAEVEEATFIVYLREQADVSPAAQIKDLNERRLTVFESLRSTAERSQRDILNELHKQEQAGRVSRITPYWIFNGLAVTGDAQTLADVASRDDVVKIRANRVHVLDEPVEETNSPRPQTVLWNIERIRANQVWNELGITGQGIVVANMDTGVAWEHNALRDKYRGRDGNHNYNWFDFTDTYPNSPGDGYNHGTHTMGIMVGDGVDESGQRLQTGVAPGAQWIAVKIFTDGTPSTTTDEWIHAAFQWVMAPTDLNGENPDPSTAPDVVNNSWGSINGADQTFRPDVEALRTAGIVPVFSAGNEGELGVGTVGSPGSFPESIAVGATEPDPIIADFSGQGPSFWNEIKPEVSAPGRQIRSTVPPNDYSVLNGTSMAAPHVSGTMALLLEAAHRAAEARVSQPAPSIDGVRLQAADPIPSPSDLEQFLTLTAVDIEEPGPDNLAGAGRIDAYRATVWAMTAGKLYGFVRDTETGDPIPQATITGTSLTDPQDAFTTSSQDDGEYSVAVPKGRYAITIQAFGYEPQQIRGVDVVAGFLTLQDLKLKRLPTGTVFGEVRTADGTAIQTTVEVVGTPMRGETDGKGTYSLDLPAGTHTLRVETAGYRTATAEVTVVTGERAEHTFILDPAPATLYVDGDAWTDDTALYYTYALQQAGIPFDTRPITDTDNVLTTADLAAYDIVVWTHAWNSPGAIDQQREDTAVVDALTGYLDQGGRLLIAGQDIGWLDGGGNPSGVQLPYYEAYLHARIDGNSASRSSDVTGVAGEIMDGIQLEFDTPFAYKRPTQPGWFSPDEVSPADDSASVIMTYDDGAGAGLRVQDSTYRIVYLSFAPDTTGPRDQLTDTFARAYAWLSRPVLSKSVDQSLATPGARLTYTITLQNAIGSPLDNVTLVDPLPEGIEFVPGSATGGAVYDQAGRTIEWAGSIPPRESAIITFQADLGGSLAGGAEITNVAEIVDLELTAPATTQVLGPNLSESEKTVDKSIVSVGETMTYTIELANASTNVTATGASLVDPIPAGTTYVAGSVTGGATYDAGAQEIRWSGDVPVAAPETAPYEWIDSDADGGPAFAWDNRAEAQGQPVAGMGDDTISDQIPIGFTFPFFNREFTSFRVASNGFLSFTSTETDFSNERLPSDDAPGNMVAPFWDDLTFSSQGTLYTWTNNEDTLIVSWVDVPRFGGSEGYTFQAILRTSGEIVFQYLMLGDETDSATIGVQNSDGSAGLGIAYNEEYVHTELAILIQPPQPVIPPPTIAFAVRVNDDVASGTVITNTAQLDDGRGHTQMLTATSRANVTDLHTSRKLAPDVILPGSPLTYTVQISNTGRLSTTVTLTDPIPAGTEYRAGSATAGATYDAEANAIEWTNIVPSFQSRSVSFAVDVSPETAVGTTITNTATVDDGVTTPFGLVATTRVSSPDLSRSTKIVDEQEARSDDVLNYTIRVANNSPVPVSNVSLVDQLPDGLTLVPDSLSSNATYDPAERAIRWSGTLPPRGEGYAWDDSDAPGGPAFGWDERAETQGTPLSEIETLGDDTNAGPLPIGFSFPFFDQNYSEFSLSTNGFLTFNELTSGDRYFSNKRLPEPDAGDAPGNLVAVFWDDLDLREAGEIYYWTNDVDTLIVSWIDVPHLARGGPYTFQAILQSDGTLTFQYADVDENRLDEATVGIQDAEGNEGLTIAYDEPYVHDELAVRIAPPTGTEQVGFQAEVDADVPLQTTLINTVVIKDGMGNEVEREAKTVVNTIDLSGSAIEASANEIMPGERLTYRFVIPNSGTADATETVVVNPLPAALSYVDGSATNGAVYNAGQQEIRWEGEVPAGDEVSFEYAVDAVPPLIDGDVISNTATIDDGVNPTLTRTVAVQVLAPDLADSVKQAPAMAGQGGALRYEVRIVNSGHAPADVTFTDPLPAGVTYVEGSGDVSFGDPMAYDAETRTIVWSGSVPARGIAKLTFSAHVDGDVDSVTNTASLDDGLGTAVDLEATTRVVPYRFHLPLLFKNYP